MRLCNSDVEEAERPHFGGDDDDFEEEDDGIETFFELRQRTLAGMELMSAFRIVALGAVRKLRTNTKGSVLYGEVEDVLGRYFRLLDADMQKFATLHETLRDAAKSKLPDKMRDSKHDKSAPRDKLTAFTAAHSMLTEAMRQIAVVLLACGEMQRRALDLKMNAQRAISEARSGRPPLVSFSKFAEFLDEALAVCDQLRKKHEELHQQRMRAMASAADARVSNSKAPGTSSQCPSTSHSNALDLCDEMVGDVQAPGTSSQCPSTSHSNAPVGDAQAPGTSIQCPSTSHSNAPVGDAQAPGTSSQCPSTSHSNAPVGDAQAPGASSQCSSTSHSNALHLRDEMVGDAQVVSYASLSEESPPSIETALVQ